MFGYICPQADELKVREYALYRAYYCGLCRTLNARIKNCAHLNFDCTFLYILYDSIAGAEHTEPSYCRCLINPFKKPAVYGAGAAYAADINALMAYAKACDDSEDKSRIYRAKAALLRKGATRARSALPDIGELSDAALSGMKTAESSRECSPDAAADPYARLFGEIAAKIDPYQRERLYELGYNLGRWVYLIDAWDDIEEDIKRGGYNVFVNRYALKARPGNDIINRASPGFYYTLSRAADAFSALALKKNEALLGNIISLGLKGVTKSVLERTEDGPLPRFRRKSKRNG